MSIIVSGIAQAQAAITVKARSLSDAGSSAAKAGADIYAAALRSALPLGKTGQLRRHVRVYIPKPGEAEAKVTGHEAHLVLGDTKAHEIDPKNARALHFTGTGSGFYAHANRLAHTGDHALIPRVKAEHQAEAAAAAIEVLKHE